jgi:hypothetical protein
MEEVVVEAEVREVRPKRATRHGRAGEAWAGSEARPAKARSGKVRSRPDRGEMRASGHTAHAAEAHATTHAAAHATCESSHAAAVAASKSTSAHAATVAATKATAAATTSSAATESWRCEGEGSRDRSRDK